MTMKEKNDKRRDNDQAIFPESDFVKISSAECVFEKIIPIFFSE
jgi:hypothetical protein